MTDRELLELAAKAAGYELDYTIRPDGKAFYNTRRNAIALANGGWFAPFSDDGDALRLAVRLSLSIDIAGKTTTVFRHDTNGATETKIDPCAATCRAIVRAAAEIGKNLCSNTSTKE